MERASRCFSAPRTSEGRVGIERVSLQFPLLAATRSRLYPSRMRLLVVEDDSKIASFVIKGLKEAGYGVDHCSDGEEALIMADSTPYDALIVDLMLPQLDGLSLI